MKTIVGIGITIALLFCRISSAEEIKHDENMYRIPEVNVMAKTLTGYEKALKDMASSVSIITREDIEKVHTRGATDLLNIMPGVFIQKTGASGRSDIVIRGIGNNGRQLVVLIDGRTTKMGLFGCAVTHCLPLDNVERIEVIRGPSPVLYGSESFGGVVNIITRKASKELEGSLSVSAGTYNTEQYQLHLGGKKETWDYYITSDYQTTDGHLDNSEFSGENYTGRIGKQVSEFFSAVLTFKYFDGKKYEPLRSTDPAFPPSDIWNKYERGAFDFSFEQKGEIWNNTLKIYRNFGEHEFSDGWHSKDHISGILLNGRASLWEDNMLTISGEIKQQEGERLSMPSGEWDKKDLSLFIYDEHIFKDNFLVSGGIRYTHDEIADDIFCCQAGAVYHITESTSLRCKGAGGFRAPLINELYLFPSSHTDLKEERIESYEAGIRQKIVPGVELEFVAFKMQGDDLIELELNPAPPPFKKFANTGSFTFQGTETVLHLSCREWFRGKLSYSTLDTEERTTGRPEDILDMFLLFKNEKSSFSAVGQYVDGYFSSDDSRDPIPSFFTVNIRGDYEVYKGLRIFAAVDNLFDEDYVIYADLPSGAAGTYTMPGRTFSVGMNYKF